MKIVDIVTQKFNNNKSLIIKVFIATFIIGLITHGYRYFGTAFSHDSLYLVNEYSDNWQISIGRFLQPYYRLIHGKVTLPFIFGVISLFWISLSNILIIKILDIKNKFLKLAIIGIFTTSISITLLNATFIYQVDINAFATFLAILSVYIFKIRKKLFLISSLLIAALLALYQSEIQVAIVLFVFMIIKEIINNKNTKQILLDGLKMIATLVLGLIIYYIGLNIVLKVTAIELTSEYNSISESTSFLSASILENLQLVWQTYIYPIKYFINPTFGYLNSILKLTNIMLLLIGIVYTFLIIKYKDSKKIGNTILFILSILIIPFAINFVYFISKGTMHELMITSYNFIYVLLLLLIEEFNKILKNKNIEIKNKYKIVNLRNINKVITIMILVCFIFIIWNNIIYANQVYLKKALDEQTTLSVMTRIIDKVENIEGYIVDETEVIFIGELFSDVEVGRYGFANLTGIGVQNSNITTVSYALTYKTYIEYNLGYPMNICLDFDEIHI